MKTVYLLVFLFLPSSVIGAEYLEQVESEVYLTTGTVKEISTKAKGCIAQIVHNDEVRIADTVESARVQGGNVFIDINLDSGTITVNSRVDYSAKMLKHNIKSTMLFLAKEGRFKMRHTNIESLQKNTGLISNDGYVRVGKWWGTGWKDAEKALLDLSKKIAECVQSEPKKDDW